MSALAWVVALLLGAPIAEEDAKPRVAVRHALVLKVGNRDQAADAAVALAEKLDGYFVERTDDYVRFKVPVARVKELLHQLEPLGVVIQRNVEAQDLGERMDEQRTRLNSKQEVLQRYFAVLGIAGANAVVEVESQMTQLVQEIEGLKGQLQMCEHQLRLAEVGVSFQFRDRRPPVRDGSSSFEWLNTMNLADLLWSFGHD
ncbi:MAG: DUF4349 domain-containing protein [Deltaproteobacteria bacterium]|nr:DUF4349 domain-containing protein [Deltaproteobacteria bacterium]